MWPVYEAQSCLRTRGPGWWCGIRVLNSWPWEGQVPVGGQDHQRQLKQQQQQQA